MRRRTAVTTRGARWRMHRELLKTSFVVIAFVREMRPALHRFDLLNQRRSEVRTEQHRLTARLENRSLAATDVAGLQPR